MGSQYPLGTVAFYGPTDKQATKMVAGIVPSRGAKPSALKKWNVESGDIRENKALHAELSSFLKEHHVTNAVLTEGVIGCPHEEGIDYQQGSTCPFCPFWAKRPRQQPAKAGDRDRVGRNDPCPCGSGKKFKKCCGK